MDAAEVPSSSNNRSGGSSRSSSSSRAKKAGKSSPTKASTARVAGQKLALPVCYLCSREFGTSSIEIHIKECKKRYEREHGKPPPEPVVELPGSGGADDERGIPVAKDWAAYNEQSWAQAQANLSRCERCGRTFAVNRLPVHYRSCKGPSGAKAATAREAGPPSLVDGDREAAEEVVRKMEHAVKGARASPGKAWAAARTAGMAGPAGSLIDASEVDHEPPDDVDKLYMPIDGHAPTSDALVEVREPEAAKSHEGGGESGGTARSAEGDGGRLGPLGTSLSNLITGMGPAAVPAAAASVGATASSAAIDLREGDETSVPPATPPLASVLTSERARRPSNAGAAGGGAPTRSGDHSKEGKRAASPRSQRPSSPGPAGTPVAGGSTSSSGGGGFVRTKLTARERMEQLAELLGAGMVTQNEFEAKRLEILASV